MSGSPRLMSYLMCVVDVDAPSYCGHLLWATGYSYAVYVAMWGL